MKNLKYLREQHGLSQSQLANLLNISKNTILNWEKGMVEPPFSAIIKMSQHLGFSLDDFAFKDMQEEGIGGNSQSSEVKDVENEANYLVKGSNLPTYCTSTVGKSFCKPTAGANCPGCF